MTSSEDLPAGICSAVTTWSGCNLFQAATACLPHATSCSLLEYQILIGPFASVAPVPDPELLEPHPASAIEPSSKAARERVSRFIVSLLCDRFVFQCPEWALLNRGR